MNLAHYDLIAHLFSYPGPSFSKDVGQVVAFLKEHYPSAAEDAQYFYEHLPQNDPNGMQELFTRSFDVQAVTTLDVGYVLFGDDFRRGKILSNLNRGHAKARNDCGAELADHLPNVLRLIAKLDDADFVRELVGEILAPALRKMIQEFHPKRREERNKLYKKYYKTLIDSCGDNDEIYRYALQALFSVLKQDFQVKEEVLNTYATNDFLKSIGVEMSVEKIADA